MPTYVAGSLLFWLHIRPGRDEEHVRCDFLHFRIAELLYDHHVRGKRLAISDTMMAKLVRPSGDPIRDAKREIEVWSTLVDGYARSVDSIVDTLNSTASPAEPSGYECGRTYCDDDSHLEAAAVSLGMGTKMLPSNRYGSERLHSGAGNQTL